MDRGEGRGEDPTCTSGWGQFGEAAQATNGAQGPTGQQTGRRQGGTRADATIGLQALACRALRVARNASSTAGGASICNKEMASSTSLSCESYSKTVAPQHPSRKKNVKFQ